jgi:hypothetical protein
MKKNLIKFKDKNSINLFFLKTYLIVENARKRVLLKKFKFLDLHTCKEKCKGEMLVWNPKKH